MLSRAFELVFLTGVRKGEKISLAGEKITVGRSPENTIVIEGDPSLSGHHFTFHLQDEQVIVENNSINGTFINGQRIHAGKKTPLSPDDLLQFGGQQAKVTVPAEQFNAEQPYEQRTIFTELGGADEKHSEDSGILSPRTRILEKDSTRMLSPNELGPLRSPLSWRPHRFVVYLLAALLGLILLYGIIRGISNSEDHGSLFYNGSRAWEYKTVILPLASQTGSSVDEPQWSGILNSVGQEGWEMVEGFGGAAGSTSFDHVIFIFKRSIP